MDTILAFALGLFLGGSFGVVMAAVLMTKEYMRGRRDAEAAQDWVPCSKGLPKYRETVFLTKRDGNVDIGWRDGIKEDGTDDWFELVLGGATCAIWNITAWMPRPEPYKGGDTE